MKEEEKEAVDENSRPKRESQKLPPGKERVEREFGVCGPGVYRTILVDFPWLERGGGKIKRGADKHYPLIKPADMAGVVMRAPWRAADDSHLYCWATNTHLRDAFKLVEIMGFRYITTITWAKPSFGIGRYFRGQTEHLLFAVRGSGSRLRDAWTARKSLSTLIATSQGARRIHSKKPVEAYELIEQASPGPRIELFARAARDGWDHWGNEVAQSWSVVLGVKVSDPDNIIFDRYVKLLSSNKEDITELNRIGNAYGQYQRWLNERKQQRSWIDPTETENQ